MWRSWELWYGVVHYFHLLYVRVQLMREGHGKGVVVATGKDTEFGVIFSMMQDVSTPPSFTRRDRC